MCPQKYQLFFILTCILFITCVKGPNMPDELYRDWKGQIIYCSEDDGDFEIYSVNADGSEVTQLTKNDDKDTNPACSPDGKFIAFSSQRDGNSEIYVMDVSGNNQINISNTPKYWEIMPQWSPDSKKICFASNRDGEGYYDIYTMNADGSNVQQVFESSVHDWAPTWSPDGSKICFISEMAIAGGGTDMLFIYDLIADTLIHLTRDANYAYYSPAWSPDGSSIACDVLMTTDSGSQFDVGIINLHTHEIIRHSVLGEARQNGNLWGPVSMSWSPDGSMLAFCAVDPAEGYNIDIYTMYADGTNIRRLTHSVADDFAPSWKN